MWVGMQAGGHEGGGAGLQVGMPLCVSVHECVGKNGMKTWTWVGRLACLTSGHWPGGVHECWHGWDKGVGIRRAGEKMGRAGEGVVGQEGRRGRGCGGGQAARWRGGGSLVQDVVCEYAYSPNKGCTILIT